MSDTATLNIAVSSSKKGDGLKDTEKELTGVAEKGIDAGKTLEKVGLAIGAVGVGITAYAKNATDYTVDLVKSSKQLSRETGTSIENASQLVYVAQRMGISADQASTTFGVFSKQITAATQDIGKSSQAHQELQNKIDKTKLEIRLTTEEIKKNGDKTGELALKVKTLTTDLAGQEKQLSESSNAFEKLGIKVTNADGTTRTFNEILLDSADKFKGMKDGSEKSALAMELFGRSGKDMLPILNQGSQGILQLEQQADKLGLTLNAKTVGAVTKYIQSSKDLTDSQNAMKIAVGTATAPVLTEFNTKVNQVAQSLLNAKGPLRDVTVGVLAFGGPALTAGGAALGLAGNISQVGKEGLLTAGRFGLIGIASAALAGSIGYLAYNVYDTAQKTGSATQAMSTWQGSLLSAIPFVGTLASSTAVMSGQANAATYQQQQLKLAHDATTTSQQAAKLATDNLATAELNKKGADLQVEQAQRAYNEAVRQYGPNSLEARNAAYNLEVANNNQKDAVNKAKDAVQEKSKKDSEVAKNRQLEENLKNTTREANNQKGAFDGLTDAISRYAKSAGNTASGAGGSLVNQLRNAFGGFRAAGGPVTAGQAYVVGDNPDGSLNRTSELFVPKQSGTIIPAGATRDILGGGGPGGVTINQYNTFTRDSDSLAAARQLAFELSRR